MRLYQGSEGGGGGGLDGGGGRECFTLTNYLHFHVMCNESISLIINNNNKSIFKA